MLARLKEQGQAVIFITHKLHEALSLGDFISILRQGRLAGTIDRAAMREQGHEELRAEIVRIMFGEEARTVADVAELREELAEVEADAQVAVAGDVVLELHGVTAPGEGVELGLEERLARAPRRARSSGSPASTETASGHSPRSIAGQRKRLARRRAAVRRAGDAA